MRPTKSFDSSTNSRLAVEPLVCAASQESSCLNSGLPSRKHGFRVRCDHQCSVLPKASSVSWPLTSAKWVIASRRRATFGFPAFNVKGLFLRRRKAGVVTSRLPGCFARSTRHVQILDGSDVQSDWFQVPEQWTPRLAMIDMNRPPRWVGGATRAIKCRATMRGIVISPWGSFILASEAVPLYCATNRQPAWGFARTAGSAPRLSVVEQPRNHQCW